MAFKRNLNSVQFYLQSFSIILVLLCLGFSRETELIRYMYICVCVCVCVCIYIYICKGIYYKNLAHVIMEAGKSKTYGADVPVKVPRPADWKS